ncbi:MAG: GNAT family N-acetyltransferase [Lachnospiraceae bacterium]|nr:GNAT family N-acetyltransferase [Lachnospiraceae bacterium]
MDIKIQALDSGMALQYVDFFENRAFSDGNINKGCYCVWHHWTEKHEYERSLLPAEERPSVKRNYAIDLIEQDRLHGFVAWHENKIIGFCNADLKNNYFRMSKEKNPDSWTGIDNNNKVMAIVCFTIDPNYRGKGIAKKLLSYACDFASHNGYDYIESYPSDGEFNPNLCCGNRSMYESQGFTIINVSDGIVARKQVNGCEEHNV